MPDFDPYTILDKRKNYRKKPETIAKTVEYNKSAKAKEALKKYDQSDKGKINRKKKHLRSKYNLSLVEYNEKLKQQNHKCAICGTDEIDLDRSLCVDHNHETNVVRELLCNSCNTGIGMFKEDISIFQKAIAYLKKHKD
jgi:hypothetical protein